MQLLHLSQHLVGLGARSEEDRLEVVRRAHQPAERPLAPACRLTRARVVDRLQCTDRQRALAEEESDEPLVVHASQHRRRAREIAVVAARTGHAASLTDRSAAARRFASHNRPKAPLPVACRAMFYDDDADLTLLDGKTVAIIGFGSQGHAHALNLKDSGVNVVVGLRSGSKSVEIARSRGLEVLEPVEAASRGDVVMLLVPDELHHDVYAEIRDGIGAGNLLLFGHGFSIHYGEVEPPADVDVALVAPKGPGHLVRRQYTEGSGVPGLIAIQQDATGNARALALAYAKGIGCTRGGVIETTFKDETETDLFGEQAVLCGGTSELVRAGYETLVEAGYDPRLAYFEVLHELKLIVDLMYEKGIAGMRYSISNTAEYGDITRGRRIIGAESRQAMREILGEIQSGAFAREWIAEVRAGQENFDRMRAEQAGHQVEVEGRKLRSMMSWIDDSGFAEG